MHLGRRTILISCFTSALAVASGAHAEVFNREAHGSHTTATGNDTSEPSNEGWVPRASLPQKLERWRAAGITGREVAAGALALLGGTAGVGVLAGAIWWRARQPSGAENALPIALGYPYGLYLAALAGVVPAGIAAAASWPVGGLEAGTGAVVGTYATIFGGKLVGYGAGSVVGTVLVVYAMAVEPVYGTILAPFMLFSAGVLGLTLGGWLGVVLSPIGAGLMAPIFVSHEAE